MRNARFWLFWRGGWVKVTLTERRPTLFLHDQRKHEEGYSCAVETYTLTADGVACTMSSWGSDCDGHHGDTSEWFAPHSTLNTPFVRMFDDLEGLPPHKPEWGRISAEQYDEYAELAGY